LANFTQHLADQEKENINHSHLINAKQGTNSNLLKDKLSKNELLTAANNSNPVTASAKVRPPLHAPKNGLEGLIREVKSGKSDPKKLTGSY
jgi:hypothetical protein